MNSKERKKAGKEEWTRRGLTISSHLIAGLLSHMEHMRMDPKHQFAAQYVLSRAAADRREREILASSSLGIK